MPKRGRRRSFSAAEKLRVVRQAAACTKRGEVEALLRREGCIAELEQRAARLEGKLSLAEKLIDLQKKVSAILGLNFATEGES